MKKNFILIATLALLTFVCCKKEVENEPIKSIRFGWIAEPDSIIQKYNIGKDGIFVGINSSRITVIHQEPIYAKGNRITYSSKNPNIVKIDIDGKITGVSKGSTYIYISAKNASDDKKPLKDSCKVYVDTISVTKINISIKAASFSDYDVKQKQKVDGNDVIVSVPNTDTLFLNDKAILSSICSPIEASFQEVVWESSNPTIFKVNGDTITALQEGEADIVGKLKYNHHNDLTINYSWKVKKQKISSVIFSAPTKKISEGANEPVEVLFMPSFTSDKGVSFWSENDLIVNVVNGKVYAFGKAGQQAKIAVISTENPLLTDTCTFKIIK